MSVPNKRIAVVGGGPAGILATYWLKKEGLQPFCYEKAPYFCSTWNYHDEDIEGLASVMWATFLNSSKEIGSFSGKVPKAECPIFMKHNQVLEMFKEFADDHDIVRHIRYYHEVIRVLKAEDYEDTGRYVVKIRNSATGEVTENTFDGVLVCVGHLTHPNMAQYPGMETYKGKIMHTHSLKKVDEFKNQKVVVVGVGPSGLDAAVETSNVAKQMFLSARSGVWVIPRDGPWGMPFDFTVLRRFVNFFVEHFPISVTSTLLEYYLNIRLNHDLYNLRPKYRAISKNPSINDFVLGKLINGSIVVRKNIKYFTEKGVLFDGEDDITEVDSVILATGYIWKFPFLDEGILTTERNGRINLYKCMYPAQLQHPTLALIGFILPLGPGVPLEEMQCRYAAHLLAGKGRLPSTDVMMAEAKRRYEENLRRFTPSNKISIRIHFVTYLDSLASEIGAMPNLLKMAFRDPKLFLACVFGPCLPYQFRLEGPHSWPGAREAILTAHERMKKPLMGSGRPQKHEIRENLFGKYLLVLLTTSFILLRLILGFW